MHVMRVSCCAGEYNEGLDNPGEDCRSCSPAGLTTPGETTANDSKDDCKCTLPGYGFNSQLVVSQCPVGEWRAQPCGWCNNTAY
jgi:hypothetical protein